MSEDIGSTSPATDHDDLAPRAAEDRVDRPPRRGSAAWLFALAALAIAGIALWRVHALEHGQADAAAALRGELAARVAELARIGDQHKRDLDSVRARLADAEGINKSMREELLSLGQRSRHVEDAVANLAEQRLSGRDALAMNEAEFLLQQAQERLTLFRDAQAAIAAYRLADSALGAAEDPMFASVRQTIDAELRALEASKPADTEHAFAALERVRESLATLPLPPAAGQESAASSRWERFLAQFVRVSHSADTGAVAERDIDLTRRLAALDLRAAEAALLARDAEAYAAAVKRARAGIAVAFDTQATSTRSALAELDRLAAAPFAPVLPELGSALRELRNLRATRALAQPPAPKPAGTPASQSGAGT